MVALAHLAVVTKSMFLLRASSTTVVVFELLSWDSQALALIMTINFRTENVRLDSVLSDGFYTCSMTSRGVCVCVCVCGGGGGLGSISFVRIGRGEWPNLHGLALRHTQRSPTCWDPYCPCPYQEETETRSFQYTKSLIVKPLAFHLSFEHLMASFLWSIRVQTMENCGRLVFYNNIYFF